MLTSAFAASRALAERKLPELERRIEETKALRDAVADCLACGCMSFETCALLTETVH